MAIINAKKFSENTGYPLAMIREYCREGRLSHWQRGKVYLLDENEALAEMQLLKTTTIHKKKIPFKHQIVGKPIASGSSNFNFRETIRQMQAESKQK